MEEERSRLSSVETSESDTESEVTVAQGQVEASPSPRPEAQKETRPPYDMTVGEFSDMLRATLTNQEISELLAELGDERATRQESAERRSAEMRANIEELEGLSRQPFGRDPGMWRFSDPTINPFFKEVLPGQGPPQAQTTGPAVIPRPNPSAEERPSLPRRIPQRGTKPVPGLKGRPRRLERRPRRQTGQEVPRGDTQTERLRRRPTEAYSRGQRGQNIGGFVQPEVLENPRVPLRTSAPEEPARTYRGVTMARVVEDPQSMGQEYTTERLPPEPVDSGIRGLPPRDVNYRPYPEQPR